MVTDGQTHKVNLVMTQGSYNYGKAYRSEDEDNAKLLKVNLMASTKNAFANIIC